MLLLDRTAAHPVYAAWPDQGADRGVVFSAGVEAALLDCVVAATDGSSLFLGADVPVRKGTEGWIFLVAHLVDESAPFGEGDSVRVELDKDYRTALSVGHTGCHLASLALNRALADAWTKEVPMDSLGAANFDALAIESSTILQNGSRDEYRVGKSLRRKGFSTDALDDLVGWSVPSAPRWRLGSARLLPSGSSGRARRSPIGAIGSATSRQALASHAVVPTSPPLRTSRASPSVWSAASWTVRSD